MNLINIVLAIVLKLFKISFGVNIPCFGYQNNSLGLNEKGYIQTNIFEVVKTYYIGMDKINSFKESFFNRFNGHEIIYIDNSQSETDENGEDILISDGYTPK